MIVCIERSEKKKEVVMIVRIERSKAERRG